MCINGGTHQIDFLWVSPIGPSKLILTKPNIKFSRVRRLDLFIQCTYKRGTPHHIQPVGLFLEYHMGIYDSIINY